MEGLESFLEEEAEPASREYAVSEGEVRRLIGVYGTRYRMLLDRIRADRGLGAPLAEGAAEILAQVDFAVEEEMAARLSDFFMRRTPLSRSRHRRDPQALRSAAARMGRSLGWDPARQEAEIQSYLAALE